MSFTLSVLNKFKRRKFQKTKNLLTGETEADPEMIKVTGFYVLIFFYFVHCRARPINQPDQLILAYCRYSISLSAGTLHDN